MKKLLLLLLIAGSFSSYAKAPSKSFTLYSEDVKGILFGMFAPSVVLRDLYHPVLGSEEITTIKNITADCAKKLVDLSMASGGYVQFNLADFTETQIEGNKLILNGEPLEDSMTCKAQLDS